MLAGKVFSCAGALRRLHEPSAALQLTLSFCPLQRADGAGVALLQERDVSEPWGAVGRRAGTCSWLCDGLSTSSCPQPAEGSAQMGFWMRWLCVPPCPSSHSLSL